MEQGTTMKHKTAIKPPIAKKENETSQYLFLHTQKKD